MREELIEETKAMVLKSWPQTERNPCFDQTLPILCSFSQHTSATAFSASLAQLITGPCRETENTHTNKTQLKLQSKLP